MKRRSGSGMILVILLLILIGAVLLTRTAAVPPPTTPFPPAPGATVPPFVTPPPGVTQGTTPGGNQVVPNPGGSIPVLASKPKPQDTTYQGCPAQGDGGDPALNVLKNRIDSAPWYPVTIGSIVNLPWPQGIERKNRANWSVADAAQIARYEGTPVQVEGYLAGAKQQGPESCNCHATDDVDNHLWIVDSPSQDRAHSLVAEITPRVRALHPGWAFDRVRPLVDGQTRVRISGWLMLDQEHPDQVGKTRGTIWEIHPIIDFAVQRNGQWISLDTGRAAVSTLAGRPTEDPNLPPPIVETAGPGATPIPAGPRGTAGVDQTSVGSVRIADIFYDGQKGSSEPDEYVAIANTGATPVALDGWVLRDIYGGQEFTWQHFTLQSGQTIRIYTNEVHPESGGFSFGSKAAIWNNSGDAAELFDASNVVVSTFAYGNRR